MRTQTKCTLSLCGLFIVEILPVPFTALYTIYAIRKRSAWVPGVVHRLYSDRPVEIGEEVIEPVVEGHDPMSTRRLCTITLVFMLLVDILVPFTVPFGLYIVRKRPWWFRNVVVRLYADLLQGESAERDENPEIHAGLEEKYLILKRNNQDFVRSFNLR